MTEETNRGSGPIADTVFALLQQVDLLEASARNDRLKLSHTDLSSIALPVGER